MARSFGQNVGCRFKCNSNVNYFKLDFFFKKLKLHLNIKRYIFWNEHEPYPGVYDFEGQNDIFEFISLADKRGFVVVLRPGFLY